MIPFAFKFYSFIFMDKKDKFRKVKCSTFKLVIASYFYLLYIFLYSAKCLQSLYITFRIRENGIIVTFKFEHVNYPNNLKN